MKYDVCISFAGEDRETARSLAKTLHRKHGLEVFYDDDEQAQLWGVHLTERLTEIYRDMARYCVVIVSAAYRRKRWTTHEWRSAQARAFMYPGQDYILPLRLDDTDLPGLLPTVGFIDLRKVPISRVAKLLHDKVAGQAALDAAIRNAQRLYASGDTNEALTVASDKRLDHDIEALYVRADCHGKNGNYVPAVKALEAIIVTRPSEFLAHFLVAIFYFRMKKFRKAIEHYEIANSISPGHPTIQNDLPQARLLLAKQQSVPTRNKQGPRGRTGS